MNLLTAVESKGITLRANGKQYGGEFVGPCPFCREGNDRFHVWPDHPKWKGGGWWCRICQKSGDLIAFFMQMDGLTYKQACHAAGVDSKDYGHRKPESMVRRSVKPVFKPAVYDPPSDLWMGKAIEFVDRCHEALMASPAALEKLARDRGITADTVQRFKLGMNAKDFYRPRAAWGLPEEIKEATGKPKKLWIPRGLVVPYLVDGKVMRIRVRRPKADLKSESDIRYYFVPGSSPAIMMIADAQRAAMVIESELDGILVAQDAGDIIGVIALGTAASKPDAACAGFVKSAAVILVSLDYDQAGIASAEWWTGQYSQAEFWPVPEGKDPGEMWKRFDVRSWVLAGFPDAWLDGPEDKNKVSSPPAPAEFEPVDKKDPASELPPAVMELYGLLRTSPVRILSTQKRRKIEEAPAWNNNDASKRISRLVFADLSVDDYLIGHPSSVIDGKNFLYGR